MAGTKKRVPPQKKLAIARGRKARHDSKLTIEVVERLFEGSVRWFDRQSHRTYTELKPPELNRQQRVVERITRAWADVGRNRQVRQDLVAFAKQTVGMISCVDPKCEHRFQIRQTSKGWWPRRSDDVPCTDCEQPVQKFQFRKIESKFLYILTGDQPRLAYEILATKPDEWLVIANPGIKPRSRRKLDEKKNPRVKRTPAKLQVKRNVPHHFFLSTVQLSKGALQLLVDSAKESPSSPDNKTPRYPIVEQLFATTLRRTFGGVAHSVNKRSRPTEVVAVIDPFGYVQEVNHFDFRPVLAAHFELLMNPNEKAKLGMAAILSNLIGQPPDGSRKYPDNFDLIDEMEKSSYKIKGHKAAAWLKEYKKCLEFLAKETEYACIRLLEWLDSPAHRIVEMSCQQEGPNRDALALGILHYSAVLRDIMGSQAGKAFMVDMHKGAGDYKNRLPYSHILHPGPRTKKVLAQIRKKEHYGDIAANLLGLFAPAIIRQTTAANEQVKAFGAHLVDLGFSKNSIEEAKSAASTKGLGWSDFRLAKGSFIDLQARKIEKTGKAFLSKRMEPDLFERIKVWDNWEKGITGLYSVWTGFKVYSEKPKAYEGSRDKFMRKKAQIQHPFNVLGFVTNQSKLLLAYRANRLFKIDLAQWVDSRRTGKTVFVGSESLKRVDMKGLEHLRRLMDGYRVLSYVDNILSGPIALGFGGIDLVVQTQDTIISWQDGDYGKAVGGGLLAMAGVIGVTTSVVTTLALFKVPWALALAPTLGPLAIVAAIVTLGGAIIIAVFSKSDLEMYTAHCFLGDEYGEGAGLLKSSGSIWSEGSKYPNWKEKPDRFQRQARYLVNLIGTFSMSAAMGPHLVTPYGCWFQPGYLPPGSIAELDITLNLERKDARGKFKPIKKEVSVVVALDTGEFFAVGDKMASIEVNSVPNSSWGSRKFLAMQVQMQPKLAQDERKPIGKVGGVVFDSHSWAVKAKLDIGGSGHYLPPDEDEKRKQRRVLLEYPQPEGLANYAKADSLNGPFG